MPDETELILGDAVAAELQRPRRRKWLRRKKTPPPPLTHCENCGTALTGPFCAQCGQPAIDYRRSFPSLLADAADAFFNFDARFFQSFGWLLLKPWRLTNEFIEGKRARHVHPLRVYLIASVIFFLVINFLSRDSNFQEAVKFDASDEKAAVAAVPAPLQIPLAPAESGTEENPGLVAATPGPFHFDFSAPPEREKAIPEASATPGGLHLEVDRHARNGSLDKWIERRAKEKLGPTGNRVDLFMKGVIHNLAPMVLCCIPLFALVLKILYIFKRRYYIEHLVFALHTHAFVFLSTVLIIGIGFLLALKSTALTALVCTLLGTAVVVQLLFAIRRVYRQNWFASIFKFLLGSLIYCILLSLAFGITATATLLLP